MLTPQGKKSPRIWKLSRSDTKLTDAGKSRQPYFEDGLSARLFSFQDTGDGIDHSRDAQGRLDLL